MDENLWEKVEKRIKQADSKNLYVKGRTIASYLGKGYETSKDANFVFKNREFEITYDKTYYSGSDRNGFFVEIMYKGKQVFEETGQVDCYIPSRVWEKKLNELYRKAERVEAKKEKEEKMKEEKERRKEEKEIRSKWGLRS